ncbi:hypothetical protein JCM3775_004578 [Rhodotorula graminis]|uniref:Carbohydrate esterase family 16 protein n=1 Tax=Rhodotorula graminis (strain WP1) TaxID=578459 RepID=A0A194SC55_RHOGW|nr:uncharacterized protein RHOBADRAFT_66115 [Rhodotorula graminis WP1]KPV76976.1 hypothetical protein RHOBADRAFT_66115 [Rhodotorula graminis WP1]
MAVPRPLVLLVAVVLCILVLGGSHHHKDKIKDAYSKHRGIVTTTRRSRFKRVVSFGDSLSDAGNGAWLFTNKTWPKDGAYVGHRFTNGPVFTEYVAQTLRVPLISYATGGASISYRVSSRSGEHGMMPVDCIFEQIKKYSEGKTDESDTLFILYAGANDAYFALDEGGTPAEVVDDLKTAVKNLQKIGGQYIVIPTLPPIGENYPYANALPEAAPLMYFFSTELRKQYMEWAKKETKVAIADFYSLFNRLMGKPEDYGFKREYLKVGCIAHNCKDDWREFIWFDDYHPTTYVHSLMAEESLDALDKVLKPNHRVW